MVQIFNESNLISMQSHIPPNGINIILTSPFYNTNKKAGKGNTLLTNNVKQGNYQYLRYDTPLDNMSDEEYNDYTVALFEGFDKILKPNGIVLYNINYGSENTDGMFLAIAEVLKRTNFSIADVIVWKKKSALPNSVSPNKLTRIWEFIFVLCRKDEKLTFQCNKVVKSYRATGQANYNNVFNLIEAKNNDGACPFNKATFSTDLCDKLLDIYAKEGDVIYDPFMGSGTTAVACWRRGLDCYGSEISENQVKWANERLAKEMMGL